MAKHPKFYFVSNDGNKIKLGRWPSKRFSVLSLATLRLHINPQILVEAVRNLNVSGFPPVTRLSVSLLSS